jgi:hypothetical protein
LKEINSNMVKYVTFEIEKILMCCLSFWKLWKAPRVGAIVVGGDWLARGVYRCSSSYLNLKVMKWYYYKYLVWFMWSDCKVKKGIMSRM